MCVVATTAVGLPVALDVNVSPASNTDLVLSVPDLLYFTNKVSGSVPSVADTLTTSAVTPEVPPVKVVLRKVDIATPEAIDDNFIDEYSVSIDTCPGITIAPCLNIWSPNLSIWFCKIDCDCVNSLA